MKEKSYNKIISSEEFKKYFNKNKEYFIFSGDIEYDIKAKKLIKEVKNG